MKKELLERIKSRSWNVENLADVDPDAQVVIVSEVESIIESLPQEQAAQDGLIIQQHYIDKVEDSRLAICKKYEKADTNGLIEMQSLTEALYEITHRKWPRQHPQEQSNSEWVSVDIKPNFGIYEVYINPKCSPGFNAIAIYDGEWLVEGFENSNARDFITHYKNRTQPPK